MSLRDYGRFALFILNGGVAGGKQVLPPGWIAQATTTQIRDGRTGYDYQWWTYPDGSYEAVGIFGQSIYIVPQENLIIVVSSAWAKPGTAEGYRAHAAFYAAVRKALHQGSD
jgi:CubicO group peptidase (beta-lactamase class C family)